MGEAGIEDGPGILVAARGTNAEHGLWRFVSAGGAWRGRQLATVGQLSSLCRHPSLAVVYGTASTRGVLQAWRVEGDAATPIGEVPSGDDPCHLAVDPTGRLLVAANYGSSALTVVKLADDGSFGEAAHWPLVGRGADADRQQAAHPHQVLFHDGAMLVIDLGADCVRRFSVDPGQPAAAALTALEPLRTPDGSGPRHGVFLPGGRIALSGELASSLMVGRALPPPGWASILSTLRTGPARTRTPRNYPGDLQRSADGRFVYLANRGHDTIAVFDVAGSPPRLLAEQDSGGAWPQHLLLVENHLLVANWDSNRVSALPLGPDGFAGPAETLFDCPGPGWLLAC